MTDAQEERDHDELELSPSVPVPDRAERVVNDYYPTPAEYILGVLPYLPRSRTVFDPAAGAGEILACFPEAEARIGHEIDPGRALLCQKSGLELRVTVADSLMPNTVWPEADLAVFNPPFENSEAFVRRALEWLREDPRRTVAALLRLTFLEPTTNKRNKRKLAAGLVGRGQIHREKPADFYVLPSRPHFRADMKGTDSATCAWFIWGPGRGGRWGIL
jgi:hypothetical protein